MYRPSRPGSTNVAGAPGKSGASGAQPRATRSTTQPNAAVAASKSRGAILASMRSARKGLTSIVVGLIPRNWAASAVVPDPPNGSAMWRTTPVSRRARVPRSQAQTPP